MPTTIKRAVRQKRHRPLWLTVATLSLGMIGVVFSSNELYPLLLYLKKINFELPLDLIFLIWWKPIMVAALGFVLFTIGLKQWWDYRR